VALFKEGSAEPAANRTAIVEFQVDGAEAEFARLKDDLKVVHEPKMMPWGKPSDAIPRSRRDTCRFVYACHRRRKAAVCVEVGCHRLSSGSSPAATADGGGHSQGRSRWSFSVRRATEAVTVYPSWS